MTTENQSHVDIVISRQKPDSDRVTRIDNDAINAATKADLADEYFENLKAGRIPIGGTPAILPKIPDENWEKCYGDYLYKKRPGAPSTMAVHSFLQKNDITGSQAARMTYLSDGRQVRKYTGGSKPRQMNGARWFALHAHVMLSPDQIDGIEAAMEADLNPEGASLDLSNVC